jgi:hypothetical protein
MMIRSAAGFDPARFEEVSGWPLRDLFLAYLENQKQIARESYHTELLIWASLAPHSKRTRKAPDLPKILKGR